MNRFGDLQMFQAIAVYVIVFLIVILILRELWCWYFKLNKMVSLLTEIRDYLKSGTLNIAGLVMILGMIQERLPFPGGLRWQASRRINVQTNGRVIVGH